MGAQLASTVYVQDPDTHQTVTLEPGTCPEPRLAALVTNPSAWVDGKLPTAAKKAAAGSSDSVGGNGPDGASGDTSAQSSDADNQQADDGDSPGPARKTAARKTAAKAPARGREAAGQGDGSQ